MSNRQTVLLMDSALWHTFAAGCEARRMDPDDVLHLLLHAQLQAWRDDEARAVLARPVSVTADEEVPDAC